MAQGKRGFGQCRKLPSGRYQARYRVTGQVFTAPDTFDAREDAEAWLARERRAIADGTWTPPKSRGTVVTKSTPFGVYAAAWLDRRQHDTQPLRPRTLEHYQYILNRHVLPVLGATPLAALTREAVEGWYAGCCPDRPTMRAHCYRLVREILADAVDRDIIPTNAARIRGAGSTPRGTVEPPTLAQLRTVVAAMPDRLRAMAELSAWTGLRYGECVELRRRDVNLPAGTVRVARAVVWVAGTVHIGPPKTRAGIRTVHVPPHILPVLEHHLATHVGPGPDALLFPAARDSTANLSPSAMHRAFWPARAAAGRPDLRWHMLRHFAATMAARAGGTTAELQERLGHTTAAMSARYQHGSADRDAELARRLSELAEGR